MGAVALGVGLGLLAFGLGSAAVSDPATEDDTATEDTDRSASGTDSQESPAPTVAGITVTREQRRPVDDTDDYSLIIIGAGLAVAGGASLRLSNREGTRPAAQPKPYQPKPYQPEHRR